MLYERIMIAVDGSDTSKKALQEAIKVAQGLNAHLRVISIFDEKDDAFNESYLEFNDIEGLVSKAKIKHECKLVALKSGEGRISDKIVSEAVACKADLLVIGTHGRRGFSHLLIGSVAEGVIRTATMPVLLIRGS